VNKMISGRASALADSPLTLLLVRVSTDAETPRWLAPLYAAASPTALAVAQRIVGCRLEAEDILQDAFVASVRLRKNYDPQRGSEMAWLLAIVKSKALDRLRARNVRSVVAVALRQASSESPPDADPMANAHVRRGLSTLTNQQRDALDLAYFGGLTHVEIAERMSAPLGSVKTWLRTGLAQLGAEMCVLPAVAARRHVVGTQAHEPLDRR
jgi:RNA polymerase sigma-70 factor (ECF subfamily)